MTSALSPGNFHSPESLSPGTSLGLQVQITIKTLIANVLTLALDNVHDSHRISNQVLILIVHYSVELSPSPVCVVAIDLYTAPHKGRRSGESAVAGS